MCPSVQKTATEGWMIIQTKMITIWSFSREDEKFPAEILVLILRSIKFGKPVAVAWVPRSIKFGFEDFTDDDPEKSARSTTKTALQTGWRFRQNKKQIQQEKNPVKQQKCATASSSVAENQISNPSRVESWSKCYHRILHLPVPVVRANVQSMTAQKVSETPPARKGGLIQPRGRWWIRRNISYD